MNFRGLVPAMVAAAVSLGASLTTANATAISENVWYEFGFGGSGSNLSSGIGFVPATNAPDGNPIVQVGDPAWTITTSGPTQLTVIDLFLSTDQFDILNNLVDLGATSVPLAGGSCGSDIACALADSDYSVGIYNLGAGSISLTGTHLQGLPGAAVFELTAAAVPEPGSVTLLGSALASIGFLALRRNRQS